MCSVHKLITLCLLLLWTPSLETQQSFATYSSQWQTLLETLKKNPALVQQLRNNPALLSTIQANLYKFKKDQEQSNECESLRKQNARLRQMIEAVAEGYDLRSLDERDFINEAFNPRPQRELGAAHSLLNQVHHSRTIVETSSVLVTPTPVWSTVVETQSYLTSVTRPVSTEVPIILRGSKVITTIFEESVVEVTATEVYTSSTLVTPTPSWTTITVSQTVAPHPKPVAVGNNKSIKNHVQLPSIWPQVQRHRNVDHSGLEHADVLEIGKETSHKDAKTGLDRLKQAYGIFFATSAQRSAQRYGNFFGARHNPLFDDKEEDYEEEYEYLDDFDQQGLAAQARPVSIKEPDSTQIKPSATTSPPSVTESIKVLTLYFSGSVPGEYSTRLSTVTVTPSSESASVDPVVRHKREAIISPSKVQTIQMTELVDLLSSDNLGADPVESNLFLQGSMVTVTKTVTETQTICTPSISKD